MIRCEHAVLGIHEPQENGGESNTRPSIAQHVTGAQNDENPRYCPDSHEKGFFPQTEVCYSGDDYDKPRGRGGSGTSILTIPVDLFCVLSIGIDVYRLY